MLAGGDEINGFLLDTVVDRLVDRAFEGEQ
jgi:hypothetical protein